MTTQTEPQRLNLKQIAELMNVAYDTVKAYHLRAAHAFPPPAGRLENTPQVGRSSPYWLREDIDAWLAQRPGPGRYDRSRAERPTSYQKSWPPEPCPVCGKTVGVKLDGLLRAHGPFAARCSGSNMPREAQRDAAS